MNQQKRGNKGRGGVGSAFNRGKRGFNVINTHNQNFHDDQVKASNGDVFQNRILVHAITQLVGCPVTIETCNGCIYDGILKTMSPKGDLILEMAHKSGKRNDHNKLEDLVQVPSRNELIETLVLGAKQVVYVSVSNVDLDEIKKDNFTDQAISSRSLNGKLGNDRQLQKWEDPSLEPDESLSLDERNVNGLDPNEMFAANEKLGVGTSFDHDMKSYTTPVQGSKELEDKAARLAREIEEENCYRDRSELDSGKTEEELFSAVVRTSSSIEQQQPPKGKPQRLSPIRDDNKQETSADSQERSSPKPQRLQQREPEVKVLDGIAKPVTAIPVEQLKAPKDVTVSDELVNQLTTKKIQPQVVGGEQSGISIVNIKTSSPGSGAAKAQQDVVELLEFHENFKLDMSKDDQKKKDQATSKDNSPQHTEQEPKEINKVTEQKPVENTQKVDDKPKFKLNPEAKEFKPCQQPMNIKTPPVQPTYFAYAPSPTQSIHRTFTPPMMRAAAPMKPRSPFTQGQRYIRPDEGHGGSPISATAATGSPIITQGPFQQYFAIQSPHQQFQPNVVHQLPHQSYNIVHPGAQGQQHYIPQQTVGIPSSQAGGQGYQDSTVPMYAPASVPMAPTSAYHPASPQPSPTTGGQFQVQYFPSPAMIQQQQGNQAIPQTVIAHSGGPQPVFVLPQQAPGQQPVSMAGIHGPGTPMMNAFVPGHQQQHFQSGN